VLNSRINAYIEATGNNGIAGGIIGYLSNELMDAAIPTSTSTVSSNYVVSKIKSNNSNYTGGMFGKIDVPLHENYYNKNLIVTNEDKLVGTIEKSETKVESLPNTELYTFYEQKANFPNTTIDKSYVTSLIYPLSNDFDNLISNASDIEMGISEISYSEEQKTLDDASLYEEDLLWSTGTWNLDVLQEGIFPILKSNTTIIIPPMQDFPTGIIDTVEYRKNSTTWYKFGFNNNVLT